MGEVNTIMSPKKKKKEKVCIEPPKPPCPPPPDICLESGLTPAENSMCAEKKKAALAAMYAAERPMKQFCLKKPPEEEPEPEVEDEEPPC